MVVALASGVITREEPEAIGYVFRVAQLRLRRNALRHIRVNLCLPNRPAPLKVELDDTEPLASMSEYECKPT